MKVRRATPFEALTPEVRLKWDIEQPAGDEAADETRAVHSDSPSSHFADAGKGVDVSVAA